MASPSFPSSLTALLATVLEPSNESRNAAEAELDRLSYEPAFWEHLCAFCTAPSQKQQDASVAKYQLVALTVLKQKLPLRLPPPAICASVTQSLCHYLSLPCALTPNVVNQTCAVVAKCIALLEKQSEELPGDNGPAHAPSDSPPSSSLATFSAVSGGVLAEIQTALLPSSDVHVVLRHRYLTLLSEMLQSVADASVMWTDAAQLTPLLIQTAIRAHACCTSSPAEGGLTWDLNEAGDCEAITAIRCGITAVGILQDLLFHCLAPSSGDNEDMTSHVARAWANSLGALVGIAMGPCAALPALTETESDGPCLPHSLSLSLLYSVLTLLTDGLASRGWYKRVGAKDIAPDICCSALTTLQADLPLYCHTTSIRDNGDEDVNDVVRLLHGHCTKRLWCLSLVMPHTPLRAALHRRLGATPQVFTRLWVLLFLYCPLPDMTLTAWEEEANAYLRDEEAWEDGLGTSTRDAAVSAVKYLVHALGPGLLVQCLEHANELLFNVGAEQENLATLAAFEPSARFLIFSIAPWKWREAAIFYLESAICQCQPEMAQCGPMDLCPVVQQILAIDTQGGAGTTHPVQVARALSCIGVLLPLAASAQGTSEVVDRAVFCVGDGTENNGVFVQLAACKLLLSLLSSSRRSACESTTHHTSSSVVAGAFAAGHRALLRLLTHRAALLSNESLYLVLDALTRWLSAVTVRGGEEGGDGNATRQVLVEPQLPQVVFDTWRAHIQDPSLGDSVLAIVRLVVHCSECDAALVAQLTWISSVICGRCSLAEQCVLPTVMRILSRIVRDGSMPLANATAAHVLDDLCVLLLCAEESAVVDAGADCLAALLERCPQAEQVTVSVPAALLEQKRDTVSVPSSLAAESRTPAPLSTVLIATALHLLRPDCSEASLFGIGPALRAIAQAASHCTDTETQAFLVACARRLADTRTDTVATHLLAPLAVLSARYPEAVYDTLAREGLLETTLTVWLSRVPSLERRRDLSLSCEALLALLHTNGAVSGAGSPFQPTVFLETRRLPAIAPAARQASVPGSGERAPWPLALFVTLGRAVVALAGMVNNASSSSDDDDEGGLFRESEDDDDALDGDEDEWADVGEDTDTPPAKPRSTQPAKTDSECVQRWRVQLGGVLAPMVPLLSVYGPTAAPFFQSEELSTIQTFFEWLQSSEAM